MISWAPRRATCSNVLAKSMPSSNRASIS
jgi:hypothetical protein